MIRSLAMTMAAAISATGALVTSTPALAVPITYTETATATGSLNGVAFTDASIVLTMKNDTDNVAPLPSNDFPSNFGAITVSVNGGMAVTFTDKTVVFVNGGFIFTDVSFGKFLTDILDTFPSAPPTYDLKSAIGPITGTPTFETVFFPTTGGTFNLTSVENPTFTATLDPTTVPEPSSLPVLALALTGLGLIFKRRQHPREA